MYSPIDMIVICLLELVEEEEEVEENQTSSGDTSLPSRTSLHQLRQVHTVKFSY